MCCQEGLDKCVNMYYTLAMRRKEERPVSAIRVKPDILYQARVSAVTQRKTLGQWLEEAIAEKIERESAQANARKGEGNEKS